MPFKNNLDEFYQPSGGEKSVGEIVKAMKARLPIRAISNVFDDGTIMEMLFNPENIGTAFAIWQKDNWKCVNCFQRNNGDKYVPYSGQNNLIKNDVVLLPSIPEEYQTEETLIAEIRDFIHRYVDLSPAFEKVATYYVLFSWIYDGFNELPYLRVRGDTGCGKTRFLLIVGSLCYKPIFASGASTVSPLFRIIDIFHGTLVIDECDFRLSDERAEIVKILNNGNARGFPVLRTEMVDKKEYNPVAYQVFGPKLVATRGYFQDRALESRCITEELGTNRLRSDIPINLPSIYQEEALRLRNMLLLFRFRNLGKRKPTESLIDRSIEPRLNQVFAPLLSIINDHDAQDDLKKLAKLYNRDLIVDRGQDTEAQILEVIRDLLTANSTDNNVSIKDITNMFVERHGAEFEKQITAKWIGSIIRKKLQIKTQKSHGIFVIPLSETSKLIRLYEKYGINPNKEVEFGKAPDGVLDLNSGDFGDLGDLQTGPADQRF